MLGGVKAIIWDFDSVINAHEDENGFIWHRDLEADWSLDKDKMQEAVFGGDKFDPVILGKKPLDSHLIEVCPDHFHSGNVQDFMSYWFNRDIYLDEDTLSLAARCADQGFDNHIGTNNEPLRAHHIWEVTGMKDRFDRLFTSGHMGLAKPETAYYQHIENTLGLKAGGLMMIDDKLENVKAAQELGWRGHHFTTAANLRSQIETFL